MAFEGQPLLTAFTIFGLSLFLDLLELSFGRILWFIRTLRFWLYFLLHFGLSCAAAYLVFLASEIRDWYLLGPFGAFLGISVIANTNVKVAGYSVVPVAELFVDIKAKMFAQAAEDKASEVARAKLIERLQRLPVEKIELVYTAALIGAGYKSARVTRKAAKALRRAQTKDAGYKSTLISQVVKANLVYAENNIDVWERDP